MIPGWREVATGGRGGIYPPVSDDLIDGLRPDCIYLTHIHSDHFHGVSLRRFAPTTQLVVPKGHYSKMKRDLHDLGFTNVVELRHGETFALSPAFTRTSYHFSPFLDSALIIECEGVTLFNVNDAKFMGWPLKQTLRRHPRIEFVLRSHSSANARMCWEVVDAKDARVEDLARYARSFACFVRRTGARYAVPFASNHCYLHKDVYHLNVTIQTPKLVEKYFVAHGITQLELKIMVSGDRWCSETGFHISEEGQKFFEEREARLEWYRRNKAPVLEKF